MPQHFNSDVVDLSGDSTVLTTKAAILRAIHVKTVMSAHACDIKDGSTSKFTIPASTAAGVRLPYDDAKMSAGITIDPHDSATGEVTVIWAPAL
jgi:hypothetical protein